MMFCIQESLLQVDSIIFDGFDQKCSKYPGKFAISLWRGLKLGTCSCWFKYCSYYKSTVLPPLNPFLPQYGIHNKSFLHLTNCLCSVSSLILFQVELGNLASMQIGLLFVTLRGQSDYSKQWCFTKLPKKPINELKLECKTGKYFYWNVYETWLQHAIWLTNAKIFAFFKFMSIQHEL